MWYLSSSSENCTSSSVEREGREDILLIPRAMELKLVVLWVLGLTRWPPKAFSRLWLYDCRNKVCKLSKMNILQKIFYPGNLRSSITILWKSEQLPTLLTHFGTEDENRWGITQSVANLWQYSLKATKKPAVWFQTAINISIVTFPKGK